MERLKVLCLVLAVVLCSTVASAALYQWDWGVGDWNDPASWQADGVPATSAPSAVDTVDLGWSGSWYAPTLQSGQTGSAWDLGLGSATGDANPDMLNIYGDLTVGNYLYPVGDKASTINIYDGSLTAAWLYPLGTDNNVTGVINQEGGTASFTYLYTQGYDTWEGSLDYQLSGGTLNIAYHYNGDAWSWGTTSDYATIDIAGGTLVMGEASFDADLTGGVILADGVTVTAANIDSLLDVSGAGTGTITATLIPEPATMVLLGLGALVLRRKR